VVRLQASGNKFSLDLLAVRRWFDALFLGRFCDIGLRNPHLNSGELAALVLRFPYGFEAVRDAIFRRGILPRIFLAFPLGENWSDRS